MKSFECEVKDLDQFRKILFKELSPLDIPEIATMDYNTRLTQKIFAMKERDNIEIVSENLKLQLLYNIEKKSKITVYLKYLK